MRLPLNADVVIPGLGLVCIGAEVGQDTTE